MTQVANSKCRSYVAARLPFKGSNLFGEYINDQYVVYSYGAHFPAYVYSEGMWFENEDKFPST